MKRNTKKVRHYVEAISIGLSFLAVISMLILGYLSYNQLPPESFAHNPIVVELEKLPTDPSVDMLLEAFIESSTQAITSAKLMLAFLMLTLFSALVLIGSQMYLWQKDRKRLEQWKNAGFLCENLEFLGAGRIKLNNIELELNKTQYNNLQKLVEKRIDEDTLNVYDLGDHGAQSMKRLREELGARFVEQTLIKNRKPKGYWLEVESDSIRL